MWASPPGNLYISTIVRVRPGDPPAPTLALVAAVALHEALAAAGPSLTIKWPNDLMADGAKLAGILLERAGEAVVIGFGVNLAHHPEGLDRPVASMTSLTGHAPDPAIAASTLAERFALWLARWRTEGLGPVRAAWLAHAHPEGTPLMTPEGQGRFAGLDPSGALLLQMPDGAVASVHAGDVFLL